MPAKKKKKPVPAWIKTLRTTYKACESGTKHLVRYKSLNEAWSKTTDPHDMSWAFNNLPIPGHDDDETCKIRDEFNATFDGFIIAAPRDEKYNWTLKARKALCNHFRNNFPLPQL